MTLCAYQLPPPTDWQAFERFTRDLFAAHWADPLTQANGRTGQAQKGVDVFGRNAVTGQLEGVQCKGKDSRYGHSVSVDELNAEVKKALGFTPALSHYYLVTTGATDVSVQEEARRVSEEHAKTGKFPVTVLSWDQLLSLLEAHKKVARQHFRALHIALAEINAPAELVAICHQSFQHVHGLFNRVDPVAASEGLHPIFMDASPFYNDGVLDARQALGEQRNLVRNISSLLRAHPDATVAYFGIAHIPLVMHAGAAASTKQAIRLYELEGASGQWEPLLDDGPAPDLGVELVDMGGPDGAAHAVIRVEVSAKVAIADVEASLDQPCRHFVIRVGDPKRGVVSHQDQARAIAHKFREALDHVHNANPKAVQHIFAAVPVSVAFRMGQMVSKTMHRSVCAYNYSQRSDPPYHWAIDLVASEGDAGQLWISEEKKRV